MIVQFVFRQHNGTQRGGQGHEDDGLYFLDFGANLGVYSLTAARLGLRVVSFEMIKPCWARLCKSAQRGGLSKKITVVDAALSDRTGERVTFALPENSFGGTKIMPLSRRAPSSSEKAGKSSFDRESDGDGGPSEEAARGVSFSTTTTLDALFSSGEGPLNIPDDDGDVKLFLKFDVEGHECAILNGANENFLPRFLKKVVFAQVEIFAMHVEKCKPFVDKVFVKTAGLTEARERENFFAGEKGAIAREDYIYAGSFLERGEEKYVYGFGFYRNFWLGS